MENQFMPPSRKGRDDQKKDERAAEVAKAQQEAAGSIADALSARIEDLYHVLGTLNESTQHFCQVMDEQQKGLRVEISSLTKSLDDASNSSTRLGIILIVITIVAGIIALPSAIKNLQDLGCFLPKARIEAPKGGTK